PATCRFYSKCLRRSFLKHELLPVLLSHLLYFISFFFNDTAPTDIYTLSLHDALPISSSTKSCGRSKKDRMVTSHEMRRTMASVAKPATSDATPAARTITARAP